MNIFIFVEQLKAKAKAIQLEHKQQKEQQKDLKFKQMKQIKRVKYEVRPENLPNASSGVTNEAQIQPYMKVLRKTHEQIGEELQGTRREEKKIKKQSEKANNPNFIKNILFKEKKKDSLRQKIIKMRRKPIFPQPKSYMNYSKRIGLLKKNSIKIE